jgi:hypothetical protein
MTREEFEQRKLRLAEQLREGVALLEQGYQRQLRALELIWMADSNGDAVPPGQEAIGAAAPAGLPVKPIRARLAPGRLLEDVRTALAQLPEVFDRNDLVRALGYEPERSSLHRAMVSLVREGVLVINSYGAGKIPAKYSKTIS